MKKDISGKLQELMSLTAETEWVEFKEAKNDFPFDELGRYFSALSNEANLKQQPAAWLIFGISDRPPRQIIGSNYRQQKPGLDKLKREIAKNTNHQITFNGIHELFYEGRRAVMFQIPPVFGRSHGQSQHD